MLGLYVFSYNHILGHAFTHFGKHGHARANQHGSIVYTVVLYIDNPTSDCAERLRQRRCFNQSLLGMHFAITHSRQWTRRAGSRMHNYTWLLYPTPRRLTPRRLQHTLANPRKHSCANTQTNPRRSARRARPRLFRNIP